MDQVTYCSGSGGAGIGMGHGRFRFAPSPEWIGVDFGGQPHKVAGSNQLKAPDLFAGVMRHHFITHTHLDHVGALPILYKKYRAALGGEPEFTLYMSEIALATAEQLLWLPNVRMADFRGDPYQFGYEDIEGVKRHIRIVNAGEMLDFEHFRAIAFNAGHVPGALYWIFLPKNGADPVFSSGDISFRNLDIVGPADPIPDEFRSFSLVVMESTYLGRVIPSRDVEKERLLGFARRVLGRGGSLIIPAFSIGSRGPEVGEYLGKNRVGPIYYDGMLKDAISLYRKFGVLSRFDERNFVRNRKHSDELMRDGRPKIVIATSGMMEEDTKSWTYACNSLRRRNDGIALIGFQGPDTPGAHLAASEKYDTVQFGSGLIQRKCDVERFQLSLHADGPEIETLLERLNPSTVVFDHGEPANIDAYIAANPKGFPWRMIRAEKDREISV